MPLFVVAYVLNASISNWLYGKEHPGTIWWTFFIITKNIMSYGFGTTWEWCSHKRIILVWTVPFNLTFQWYIIDNSVYLHREMHNENMTMTLSSKCSNSHDDVIPRSHYTNTGLYFMYCRKCKVSLREELNYSLMTVLNVMRCMGKDLIVFS